jgi:hypothetical protein
MTLHTVLHHQGHVLFIDSGTSFSAKRLVQLFRYSDRFQQQRTEKIPIRKALKRVMWTKCFDSKELITILDDLLYNRDIAHGISLMIIDSIGAILAPLSTSKGKPEMNLCISKIKQVQSAFEFPIIAINNSVYLGEPDRLVCEGSVRTKTKPALGHAWGSVLSKSLYFTPSIERLEYKRALLSGDPTDEENVLSFENSSGLVFPVVECIVERVKGTTSYQHSFYIGRFDIVSPE